jgi:hypothetical protein
MVQFQCNRNKQNRGNYSNGTNFEINYKNGTNSEINYKNGTIAVSTCKINTSTHSTPPAPPQRTSISLTNTPMQYSLHHHHYSGQHHDLPGPLIQPSPMHSPPMHSPGYKCAGLNPQAQLIRRAGRRIPILLTGGMESPQRKRRCR